LRQLGFWPNYRSFSRLGTLEEFIAYTRANDAELQYGSPGAGTVPHLACVMLNPAIGVNVTHIPYRGGAPAMQDLIAGRIDYQCPIMPTELPQIEGGILGRAAALSPNLTQAWQVHLFQAWLAVKAGPQNAGRYSLFRYLRDD
jgi:tripartite-type tricarboxylate transporter receptor subunit TctC